MHHRKHYHVKNQGLTMLVADKILTLLLLFIVLSFTNIDFHHSSPFIPISNCIFSKYVHHSSLFNLSATVFFKDCFHFCVDPRLLSTSFKLTDVISNFTKSGLSSFSSLTLLYSNINLYSNSVINFSQWFLKYIRCSKFWH